MRSPQKSENFPQSTWRFGLKEPIILNRSIGKGYKNSRQTLQLRKNPCACEGCRDFFCSY